MFIASDVRIAGNLMTGEIPTELGNLVSLINLDMRKFYNDSNYHLRSLQIFIYLTINWYFSQVIIPYHIRTLVQFHLNLEG